MEEMQASLQFISLWETWDVGWTNFVSELGWLTFVWKLLNSSLKCKPGWVQNSFPGLSLKSWVSDAYSPISFYPRLKHCEQAGQRNLSWFWFEKPQDTSWRSDQSEDRYLDSQPMRARSFVTLTIPHFLRHWHGMQPDTGLIIFCESQIIGM